MIGKTGVSVLLLVAIASPSAWAGPPTDALRGRVDQVLSVLRDREASPDARRVRIRKIADEIFDLEEISRRSLGPHWRDRTPAEREEFVTLFGQLLERSYFGTIERYQGEQIAYVGESVEGDRAMVRTTIRTTKGTQVPVAYQMMQRGGAWKIYDVDVEGISLIKNYRAQFNAIIQRSSYQGLVERLRSKNLEPEAMPRAREGG